MKKTKFTQAEVKVLEEASRRHPKCYMRFRALVVLNVSRGKSYRDIMKFLPVSKQPITNWTRQFKRDGIKGLEIRAGRGRKKQCDDEELKRYLLQSPRKFGFQQNRWTLKALSEAVPSLRGFSQPGVLKALRRAGLSYKRGQPRLHSPDPAYDEKKTSSTDS